MSSPPVFIPKFEIEPAISTSRPLARLAREQNCSTIELARQFAEPKRLEIVPGRRVGVRRDDVNAGLDIPLVQDLNRRGVRIQRRCRPRRVVDRHAHLLELGPDGTIEDDDLAAINPF
jgi:hypothetical protein